MNKFWKDSTITDWIVAVFTVVLAATSYYQWKEIHDSSDDTHKLAEATKKQADKAETISSSFQEAVAELKENNAQANKALTATIAASKLEQRAWVGANDIYLVDGTPVLDSDDTKPTIGIGVKVTNSGKTPAVGFVMLTGTNVQKQPTIEPFEPRYGRDSVGTPVQQVVHPGETLKIESKPRLSKSQMDDLKKGVASIRVYGDITYGDVFGKKHHSNFCFSISRYSLTGIPCEAYEFDYRAD